jgi:hypothetical protein
MVRFLPTANVVRSILGAASLLALATPSAWGQCATGVRTFASIQGGASEIKLRIDPRGSGTIVGGGGATRGLELGRF